MRRTPALLLAIAAAAACARPQPAAGPVTMNPAVGVDAQGWRSVAMGDPTMEIPRAASIGIAMTGVQPANIRRIDSVLVTFHNRNTLSDTLSATRGIGAARRWIFAELSRYSAACDGCLRVEYDAEVMPVPRHPDSARVNVVNVLAWLPGRDAKRVIVVGGHYDSCVCSQQPNGRWDTTTYAPGADDDGSGTAAVMELARAFSSLYRGRLDATVIFALYAGEEQGLMGSTHLAERLRREGYRVEAAFTNDIVGNVTTEDGRTDSTSVRIFAADPDNSASRELGRYVWAMGRLYQPEFEVIPVWRLDRIGRGGDHRPFVESGSPGLRFSERVENYNRQHLPTDVLEHVNFDYVAKVARLNLATLVNLASAPGRPDSAVARREGAASGGQRWLLRWAPSPGATGYELLRRRTWSPTWERVLYLGNVTQYTLAAQLDDEWVAVRAVRAEGRDRFVSLAAVMPSPAGPQVLARPAGATPQR